VTAIDEKYNFELNKKGGIPTKVLPPNFLKKL